MAKKIINIAFFFLVFYAYGQKFHLAIDKEEVQIGEPFTITLSISSDDKIGDLTYKPYSSEFPAKNSLNYKENEENDPYNLELLKDFSDTFYTENNQFVWKGKYQLTGWDSAFVIIPPEPIFFNDSLHFFPPGLIKVTSPTIDPTKPIYDIQESFTQVEIDHFSFYKFIKSNWWWLLIIIGAVAVALIIVFKRLNREAETLLSLRDETLKKIDLLEKSKSYESDLKEYYFELSVLIRKFLTAHYQISIMDKTTFEIERFLYEQKIDKPLIVLITQLLTHSDLVKFAQSKPSLVEIQNVTNRARRVVNEITDLINENV